MQKEKRRQDEGRRSRRLQLQKLKKKGGSRNWNYEKFEQKNGCNVQTAWAGFVTF